MSGIEIAIIAAATTSLIASGVSAYSQVQLANQSAEIQADQIREQQVQVRLQENEATIERQKKLQSVLATEEVTFGARGIAPGSGTIFGIVTQNIHDFNSDENISHLNARAKVGALAQQQQLVEMQRKAQVFGAYTGLLKEGANTVMGAAGSMGMPSGKPTGGGYTNAGGTYGANSAFDNQFNLNR